MIDRRTRLVTAGLLIAMPILFNLFFALLQSTFEYPDILRRPPDEVLRRFAAGGPGLIALWYGFALTPALFLCNTSVITCPTSMEVISGYIGKVKILPKTLSVTGNPTLGNLHRQSYPVCRCPGVG